jgi:soluble lytic murein transglycosylase
MLSINKFIFFILLLGFPIFGHAQNPNSPLTASERDEFRQALVDQEVGQADQSHKLFESVVDRGGRLADYALWYLAQAELNKKSADAAEKYLNKIVTRNQIPRLVVLARLELGKLQMERGQYRDLAREFGPLEKRTRGDEIYPKVLYTLALADFHQKNNSKACKEAKKLKIRFPYETWQFPVDCKLSLDEEKERIRNLLGEQALEEERARVKSLLQGTPADQQVGRKLEMALLMREGDVDKILQSLGPRYEDQKTDLEYLSTLASALNRSGDVQAAVGIYYRLYSLNPRSKQAKKALFQAAFLSYQFQDYDGANRRFQEFIKKFPSSGLSRDARWHLAWIRYLRGDFEGAIKALKTLQSGSRKSQESDKLKYWLAMSYLRHSEFQEAASVFRILADAPGNSFYNFAARARLKKIEDILPKSHPENLRTEAWLLRELPVAGISPDGTLSPSRNLSAPTNSPEESANLATTDNESEDDIINSEDEAPAAEAQEEAPISSPALVERFQRVEDLLALGLNEWVKWELFDIEKRTRSHESQRQLIEKYEIVGSFNRSSALAPQAFNDSNERMVHSYPKAFVEEVERAARRFQVPAEFIWGIMRTESQYRRDVISPVGARGLMQLMPFTAMKVAGWLNEKDFEANKLNQPEVNVRLGTRYLQNLQKKFSMNWALTAAAYNAGPHRVWVWLGGFGRLDLDEFVEHIPFLETRNYVKRVLSTAYTYKKVYKDLPGDGTLSKDNRYLELAEPLAVERTAPLFAQDLWRENWEDH